MRDVVPDDDTGPRGPASPARPEPAAASGRCFPSGGRGRGAPPLRPRRLRHCCRRWSCVFPHRLQQGVRHDMRVGGIVGRRAEIHAARIGGGDLDFLDHPARARAAMTTMRSDRKTDSKTEWVTKMTVQPIRAFSASRSSFSRCRVISSSAAKGSSIRIRRGLVTSARAMETRIFMPPDSSRG